MTANGFRNVSLPEPLVRRIDEHVGPDRIYRSRPDLIRAAVLRFLEPAGVTAPATPPMNAPSTPAPA